MASAPLAAPAEPVRRTNPQEGAGLRGRGRELQNIGALLCGQGITWIFSFLLTLYLPRFLGDANLGKLTFASSLAEMTREFVLLGTSTFLVREIARDRQKLASYLGHALVIRIVASGVVGAVTVALVHGWAMPPDTARVLYLVMGGALIGMIRQGFQSALQGMERLRELTWGNIAEKGVSTALIVALLLSGYGVVPVAAALALGAAINLALSIYLLARERSLQFSVDRRLFAVVVAGGAPFLTFNLLRGVYAWVDVPMVTLMIGQQAAEPVLGWYGAALRLSHTFAFLPTIVVMALLPSLARDFHADRERFVLGAQKSLQLVAVASVPITVGCLMLGGPLVALLQYGDSFRGTVPVLQVLGIGTLWTYVAVVMGTLLVAADRQRAMCWIAGATLAFNVLANVPAIPWAHAHLGNAAIGAAATTALTEVFCVAGFMRVLPAGVLTRRLLGQIARAHVAGVLLAGCFWLLAGWHVLTLVALGGIVYALAAVGLGAVGLADVREVLASLRRRPSPELEQG